MSTAKKQTNPRWSGDSTPINSVDELEQTFRQAEKSEIDFGLGLELEFFALQNQSLQIIPFDGPTGIEVILNRLAERFGWQKVSENGRTIGLKCNDSPSSITLEPSGAIELVLPPLVSVSELATEVRRRIAQVLEVLEPLDVSLVAMGMLPMDSIESAGLVPKERYDFMYDYMPGVGDLGREMMKLTASLQVSIDYSSEADAMRKFQLASILSPVFIALSADSSVYKGEYNNFASRRSWVWSHTDNARSGIPEFSWKKGLRYQDYVQWALDVPMYFLMREGERVATAAASFRSFMNGDAPALRDYTPTQADWELHISTLFPNARLRKYIEIRTFDQSCPIFACSLSALVKGLFYSSQGLKELEGVAAQFSKDNIADALEEACRKGLDGRVNGIQFRELAGRLLTAASESDALIDDEKQFLDRLQEKNTNWSLEEERSLITRDVVAYVKSRLLHTETDMSKSCS